MNKEYEEANIKYEDGKFLVGTSKILGLISLVATSYIGIRTALGTNVLESLMYVLENLDKAELIKRTDAAALTATTLFIPFSLYCYIRGHSLKSKNKEKAELYKLNEKNDERLKRFFN